MSWIKCFEWVIESPLLLDKIHLSLIMGDIGTRILSPKVEINKYNCEKIFKKAHPALEFNS